MIRSSETFAKNRTAYAITSVSGDVFTETSNTESSEAFNRNRNTNILFKNSNEHEWNGDNLTSEEYGNDNLGYGTAYGGSEFGGVKHFEKIKDRT